MDGRPWTESELDEVFAKATLFDVSNGDKLAFDKCGANIRRSAHGKTKDPYGWEVDHIKPESKGGGDELSNLQPLHWENNRSKGDKPDSDSHEWCEVTHESQYKNQTF